MESPWKLIHDLLTVPEGASDQAIDATNAMREAMEKLQRESCNLSLVLLAPWDICPACFAPAVFHRGYPKEGSVNYDRQRHAL